ncbi:hypothetical protein EV1_032232 [Malus domestica]
MASGDTTSDLSNEVMPTQNHQNTLIQTQIFTHHSRQLHTKFPRPHRTRSVFYSQEYLFNASPRRFLSLAFFCSSRRILPTEIQTSKPISVQTTEVGFPNSPSGQKPRRKNSKLKENGAIENCFECLSYLIALIFHEFCNTNPYRKRIRIMITEPEFWMHVLKNLEI